MRKSGREIAAQPVPIRVRTLFHGVGDVHAAKKMELIHSEPNVYLIRDFLTHSEINYFDKICTVHARSFKSSFTEDGERNEVISEERTSSHVHLTKGQDNTVRAVERRAAELVGLSSPAVEPLQIVSYRNGQKFDVHHDAGTMLEDGTIELVNPRRLVTFFVYLNNLPPNQGHTDFPKLNLSVHPERGSAVVFCNVLPDGTLDSRTIHCAQPVTGNLRKFGINIWICDCDMQELAQVRAQCTVSADQVIKDSQSALTNAERQTCKYNADVAATALSAKHDSAEGYWSNKTNSKRKSNHTSAVTDNASPGAAKKKKSAHSTATSRKEAVPVKVEEEDYEYSTSSSADLFSYSADYWADFSSMGVPKKGPLLYSSSSGSGGSSGYASGSSSNGVSIVNRNPVRSSSHAEHTEPTLQSSESSVIFTDMYSFLNTTASSAQAAKTEVAPRCVIDLCSTSEGSSE